MDSPISKGRVLIADDDPLIRRLLARIVRREGMNADTAIDGVSAIHQLDTNEYDAVLLDLMMPRMSGFDVIDYLKERVSEDRPFVFVITAYGDDEWQDLDPETVTGIVRKPFEIADLGQILKLCLTRRAEGPRKWSSVPSLRLLSR